VSDYALFLAEVVFQDFPVELFTQRPTLVQSLCGFISTVPEEAHLGNSVDALNLFLGKLRERMDTCGSLDWSMTHQPGYPHGYEIGGIDSQSCKIENPSVSEN